MSVSKKVTPSGAGENEAIRRIDECKLEEIQSPKTIESNNFKKRFE